jgi:hypothetical protein
MPQAHTNAFIETLHELLALQHEHSFSRPPLDILNSMTNVIIEADGRSLTVEFDNDEEVYCVTLSIVKDATRGYTQEELESASLYANRSTDACPGCGREPGDGINPACNDMGGCGFWRREANDLMGPTFNKPNVRSLNVYTNPHG